MLNINQDVLVRLAKDAADLNRKVHPVARHGKFAEWRSIMAEVDSVVTAREKIGLIIGAFGNAIPYNPPPGLHDEIDSVILALSGTTLVSTDSDRVAHIVKTIDGYRK